MNKYIVELFFKQHNPYSPNSTRKQMVGTLR